jgi:hypothetical protein
MMLCPVERVDASCPAVVMLFILHANLPHGAVQLVFALYSWLDGVLGPV